MVTITAKPRIIVQSDWAEVFKYENLRNLICLTISVFTLDCEDEFYNAFSHLGCLVFQV